MLPGLPVHPTQLVQHASHVMAMPRNPTLAPDRPRRSSRTPAMPSVHVPARRRTGRAAFQRNGHSMMTTWKRLRVFVLVMLCVAAVRAGAQENTDCLACHSDKEATGTRQGASISIFVDEATFLGSAHKEMQCVGCHTDVAGKDFPHDEDLAPVDCGTCHGDEQELHARSLHGQAMAAGDPLAPHCRTATATTTSCRRRIRGRRSPRSRSLSRAASVTARAHLSRTAASSTRTTSSRTSPRVFTARGC